MAKLFITEFASVYQGRMIIPQTPGYNQPPLAIGTEVDSLAFKETTRVVRVHTDAICSIAFGSSPTASVDTMRLAANQTEYFAVNPGEKLSVISNT